MKQHPAQSPDTSAQHAHQARPPKERERGETGECRARNADANKNRNLARPQHMPHGCRLAATSAYRATPTRKGPGSSCHHPHYALQHTYLLELGGASHLLLRLSTVFLFFCVPMGEVNFRDLSGLCSAWAPACGGGGNQANQTYSPTGGDRVMRVRAF